MESRQENSETSTRKNYEHNEIIILGEASHPESNRKIQEGDEFSILISERGSLCYSSFSEHGLIIEKNISNFEYWRCLFTAQYVDGSSSHVCIKHRETNLYLSVDSNKLVSKGASIPIILTERPNKYSEFEIQSPSFEEPKYRNDKAYITYDSPLNIKNIETGRYLQVTEQNKHPHLSNVYKVELSLKLYRKGNVQMEDSWITNDFSSFLQNGDLVRILNVEKNCCLSIEPKSELVSRTPELRPFPNKKYLETENYQLVEKQISQLNNSNIIESLWKVAIVNSFNPVNNSLVYNRDTIIFRHCYTNICLYKSWSSGCGFGTGIFELGRDDQSSNSTNCGFHIKNIVNYCFDFQKANEGLLSQQPIYLNDTVELDHRFQCHLQKVKPESISFLKIFNHSIVEFCDVLVTFLTNVPMSTGIRKYEFPEDRMMHNLQSRLLHKNSRDGQEEDNEIEIVDYDRLKEIIRAYSHIYKILIVNKSNPDVLSHHYILKTTLFILDLIGNSIKNGSEIRSRSKPILQPFIFSAYEYFVNTLDGSHFSMRKMILSCIEKLVRIDSTNTVSLIYYFSRIWNPNYVIEFLFGLTEMVEEEQKELLYTCIADTIQYCNNWREEEPKKVRDFFEGLKITVMGKKEEGVVMKGETLGTVSVLNFKDADPKTIQLLRIAVFSEVFEIEKHSYDEILKTLLCKHQSNKKSSSHIQGNEQHKTQGKIKRIQSLAYLDEEELRPYYRGVLIEFINYYLLNTNASTISCLKNRKFVLLNSKIGAEFDSEVTNNESDIIIEIPSDQDNERTEQNSVEMLRKEEKLGEGFHYGEFLFQTEFLANKKVKSNTNIYNMVNFEEPSVSIKEIIQHLDRFIDNLQFWDAFKGSPNVKTSPTKKYNEENQDEKNDDKLFSTITQAINIGIVSYVNQAADSPSSYLFNKSGSEHLCFMLENFNTVVSIMDIVLSVGFTSLKMLCTIEEFAIEITTFLMKFRNEDGSHLELPSFMSKYERTSTELASFYKTIRMKGGLSIKEIVVEQKIRELFLSLNELFTTIMMLKKRIIVHPSVEPIDRHQLFNIEKCLISYLDIYSMIHKNTNIQQHSIEAKLVNQTKVNTEAKIDGEIIHKLLNFCYGNYHEENEEIYLISLPLRTVPDEIDKTELEFDKYKHSLNASSEESIENDEFSSMNEEQFIEEEELDKKPDLKEANHEKFQRTFKNCEEIVHQIEEFLTIRQQIETFSKQKHPEATKMIFQMKKHFDVIVEQLNSFKGKNNSEIDEKICRAYEISEKLVEAMFCAAYFEDELMTNVVEFLCVYPPQFTKFAKLSQNVNFNIPLANIFIKSLEKHILKLIKIAAVESKTAEELQKTIETTIKVIETCRSELKEEEFIDFVGVICEMFPNRTLSEKVYHILLQMNIEEKNKNKEKKSKIHDKKILFDTSFKASMSLGKLTIDEDKNNKISPSKVMEAFKTLETFKDLVKETLNEERIEEENKSEDSGAWEAISRVNKHISLIFKLCENSAQVNNHFVQNIIKYDSLLLIAFDNEIPYKFKIPLSIYFRSDNRKTEEEVLNNDYLGWISEILRDYESYLGQVPEYIYQNDFVSSRHRNTVSTKIMKGRENKEGFQSMKSEKFAGVSEKEFYYWELLYFRPFKYREEGILVLLEEILMSMKELTRNTSNSIGDSIERSITEIDEYLNSLYSRLMQIKKLEEMVEHSKIDYAKGERNTSVNFIKKIKRILMIIKEKFPATKRLTFKIKEEDKTSNECIAFEIVRILFKEKLLKRFIKIFFESEDENYVLPIFEKKQEKEKSDTSEGSQLNFKHSRSSKMSYNSSRDNFRLAEMAIFKKNHKQVSIKEFDFEDEDGNKSSQAMINDGLGERMNSLSRKVGNLKLSKGEHKYYKFKDVVKKLSKVCELTYDRTIVMKLEENLFNFCENKGTEGILLSEINKSLLKFRAPSSNLDKNSKNIQRYAFGIVKSIVEPFKNNFHYKIQKIEKGDKTLFMLLIRNLIDRDETNAATEILKSLVNPHNKPQTIEFAKIHSHLQGEETPVHTLEELTVTLDVISSKSSTDYNFYQKYLPIIKYLLLFFLPAKPSPINSCTIQYENKISNFIGDYITKLLLFVEKNYKKTKVKSSDSIFERDNRKKETMMTLINRVRESVEYSALNFSERKYYHHHKKETINQGKTQNTLVPEMQIELYGMIELYAIAESRMSQLQKELHQLISNRIPNLLYNMTLSSSLKLIFKSLLEKFSFNSALTLPDIINNNLKLEQFMELKIKEMSSISNLLSSNMVISENFSLISIYYDYLYRQLWDHYQILHINNSEVKEQAKNKQPNEEIYSLKQKNSMWEAICILEERIAALLMKEKKGEDPKKIKIMINALNSSNSEDNGRYEEDYERFRVLHKILTQSINLFNLKMLIETRCQETIKWKKNDTKFQYKKDEIPIWNLSKFIESRSAACGGKGENLNMSQSQVDTYRSLFQCLGHLILPIHYNKNDLLCTFLNEHISPFSVYTKNFSETKTSNEVYFYKKYGSEWNYAVLDVIFGKDGLGKSIESVDEIDETNPNRSNLAKEIKAYKITEYLIAEAPSSSSNYFEHNNESIYNFSMGLSLLIILTIHCVVFVEIQIDDNVYFFYKDALNILLYINLFSFVVLFINKLLMFWKVSKLITFAALNTKFQKSEEQSKKIQEILQTLVTNYWELLLIMLFLIIINISSIFEYRLVPFLFFVLCFVERKILGNLIKITEAIIKSGWIPLLLMLIMLWLTCLSSSYRVDTLQYEQFEDTPFLEIILSITGYASLYYQENTPKLSKVFLNFMMYFAGLCLVASIIGHFRWNEENKEVEPAKRKNCMLCKSINEQHIKYNHNLIKLIDLQVTLLSKCESSLCELELFLKNNIQNQNSLLFSSKQESTLKK